MVGVEEEGKGGNEFGVDGMLSEWRTGEWRRR